MAGEHLLVGCHQNAFCLRVERAVTCLGPTRLVHESFLIREVAGPLDLAPERRHPLTTEASFADHVSAHAVAPSAVSDRKSLASGGVHDRRRKLQLANSLRSHRRHIALVQFNRRDESRWCDPIDDAE